MRRSNSRKQRLYLLTGLFIFCLFMMFGLGYALLTQELQIKGTSSITSEWNILITNIETKEVIGGAKNVTEPTHSGTSATMNASFESPGDSIQYEITVENLGTLNAVLDSLKIQMKEQDAIKFTVDGIQSGDALNVDDVKKFTVTMKYNENITEQPETGNIQFDMDMNYYQEGNESNFAGADKPTIEELSIQNVETNPKETSVTTTIHATNAIKYYFSMDNDKWYETNSDTYTIYHLQPYTEYTIYVKAEDVSGNVVYSSKTFMTDDTTKPNVQLVVGEHQKGENDWYQGMNIDVKVTDNHQVKSSLYCITTEESCTPSETLTLEQDKATVQLGNNMKGQKVCVKATDLKGNETLECSKAYFVDGKEPSIKDITLTPDDDTMSIVVDSSDLESGVYTYYYSKDGGQEYIESKDSNYTFTSLEEKDYLVSVYVKDKAGNESEPVAKSTTIRYADFCTHNDITNLSDCVIAQETQNINIEEAKVEIESKGTPNFNVTSPSIVYQEKHATNTNVYSTTTYHRISTAYTFNQATGYYTLTNSVTTDPESLDFSDGKVYYTCTTTNTTCSTMYKITNVTTSADGSGAKTYKMTKYDYTSSVKSYDNSESGMYASTDNDGKTYYYRGAVAGNYVKLNNQYYRIIRVNGDGTIRMIYDGTSPHENGEASSNRQVGTSAFNPYYSDNGYIGYMYGDMSQNQITEGKYAFEYPNLSATAKYYFGSSYSYDKSKNAFTVAGDIVSATITEYKNQYNSSNYYTCFSTSKTGTCQRLLHVTSYRSATSMNVKAVENASISYNQAHSNINNSTMKNYLENWYTNNLSGVDEKISKTSYFCNDRTMSTKNSGAYENTGYGNVPTIYEYERFYSWASQNPTGPKLTCTQANDKFTVSSASGNGKLTKPIGLITADEANMAGGKTSSNNMLYYLYTGTNYWTMSPSYFNHYSSALEFRVTSSGELNAWVSVVDGYGVRPVVNLNSKNLTFTGTGTMQDPYVIE